MPAAAGTGLYVGWCRAVPRGRWKAVARGRTEGEAWELLLGHVGGPASEKTVLPEGQKP